MNCTKLLVAMLAWWSCCIAAEAAQRPNVVVILTDDVGWGDYPSYNSQSKIRTPNLDRLAREGMRFTHAHTPAALCSPTRYSMLTGNYPWRGRDPAGTWGFNVPSQILPGQQTVANLLQTAGYRTAMFGKSGIGGEHVSKQKEPDFSQPMTDGPEQWGFDYSYIIPRGHQAWPHLFLENGKPECGADAVIRAKGDANYSSPGWKAMDIGDKLLAHAEQFLDDVAAKNKAAGKDSPFYLHFCTDGAHSPYTPAKEIRGTALAGQTQMTEHTDMVLEPDLLLGKLLESLERRGLLKDTLVCFTSDNGGIPVERKYGHDAVAGLRGKKSYIFEGGHRVPFLVCWPGRVPANTVRNQVVGTHDIVATALELAGVNVPADQCLDAVSLVPVLLGRTDDSAPVRRSLLVQAGGGNDAFHDGGFTNASVVFSNTEAKSAKESESSLGGNAKKKLKEAPSGGMSHALYEGDWKLVIDIQDQPAALYNLQADLGEQQNLIAVPAQAERVKQMTAAYRDIRSSKRSTPVVAAH